MPDFRYCLNSCIHPHACSNLFRMIQPWCSTPRHVAFCSQVHICSERRNGATPFRTVPQTGNFVHHHRAQTSSASVPSATADADGKAQRRWRQRHILDDGALMSKACTVACSLSGWSLKKIDGGPTTFDPEASKNIDAAGLIESYMAGRATHWQVLMSYSRWENLICPLC